MTWAPTAADLQPVRAALLAGSAAVVPNPPPLTYVVVATSPGSVNTAKGRPHDQEVAAWIRDDPAFRELAAVLVLDPPALGLAYRLLVEELVTLLVPLRPDRVLPAWIAPAVRAGYALLFGARWAPLLPLLAPFDVLYVSSANRTGQHPASRARDAVAMFGAGIPVLDADGWPGAEPRQAATTMLRLRSDGGLDLVRGGAQDAGFASPAAYLAHLRISD
ncbi:hypothetical protein ND748_03225 [Frankia sp. AiPs1]|uniref:hypothetical protein n=1 Tax=Frankia sp. AiPs1 TaxID=573493 RepID=UPI0020442745|nr:hypothetical protein [Frankia sp. AiPs1]MCM3920689.1 hypothetical protein [Frankia sp. AiPs1]